MFARVCSRNTIRSDNWQHSEGGVRGNFDTKANRR